MLFLINKELLSFSGIDAPGNQEVRTSQQLNCFHIRNLIGQDSSNQRSILWKLSQLRCSVCFNIFSHFYSVNLSSSLLGVVFLGRIRNEIEELD